MKKVDKPINHSLIAQTHPPLVMCHKYWARKPINVVKEYIEYFTEEGDIVCDPFTGSGITNISALELKRRTIGVDINPLGIFITRMTACHADISKFNAEFEKLEKETKPKINDLYEIKCPNCNKPTFISHTIVERKYKITPKGKKELKNVENENEKKVLEILNNDKFISYSGLKKLTTFASGTLTKQMNQLINEEDVIYEDALVEYRTKCENCKDKRYHKFNKKTLISLEKKFENTKFKWYPKDKLIHNSRIGVYKGMKVCDLFSQRNLKALSILLESIEKINRRN